MRPQRDVLLLILGLAAAASAVAQASGSLRWRAGASSLGLQLAAGAPALQCGALSLACDTSTTVPLYESSVPPRSVSVQVGSLAGSTAFKVVRSQGLSLALVGKAGLFSDLGVYGRVGTVAARGSGFAGLPGAEGGLTYGVGLSWDFSRSASAVLGFDSYDMRGAGGDTSNIRNTSLGLQWRY